MSEFSAPNSPEVLNNEEENINIRELVFQYLRYWKWILLSVILFLSIGVLIYMMMDREYSINATVLLKEDKGSSGSMMSNSPLGGLQELGLLGTTNNIDNEIAVFSSPNLIRQVVLELELNVTYFEKGILRNTEVYTKSPYYVKLVDIDPLKINGEIELLIEPVNNTFQITGTYADQDNKEDYSFDFLLEELPGFIDLPENLGRLYIVKRPDIEIGEKSYLIRIVNAQLEAYSITEKIGVAATTKSSSVLNLSFNTLNIEKGVDLLNKVIETYNRNNVLDNSETSKRTADFIDTRLIDIARELGDVEGDIVKYKTKEGIANIEAESQVFIDQTAKIQESTIQLMTQIKTLELVGAFMNDPSNNYKLISTLGILDPGLIAIITNYNELLVNYERLNSSTSAESPARKRAEKELESVRGSIQKSIRDVNSSLDISKNELDKQIATLASRVHSVPRQEMELIEIMRQREIKQALFIYLMKIKEETNITMASTFDKAKVITDPVTPIKPSSPKRSVILFSFLILGIIIPVAIIFLREKLKVNISSREELEKLSTISVIGEIIKKAPTDPALMVKTNQTSIIVELFRALRNNIKFILRSSDKKVILVTSTIPEEGKTFVSINLAASFALSERKVLLIGADIRNPQLANDLKFKKGAGLTSYLSGDIQEWESLIANIQEIPNLDILQGGVIPPNPNELLMKKEFEKLITSAKEKYDIIIIDSAPVGVISDTFIFAHLADMTAYVARENTTPKEAIKFVNTLKADEKLPSIYFVLNGAELNSSTGRYGYGNP